MIDLNRGVTMRTHPAGMKVCMYKDAPGVYLDERGILVSETVAQQAGFDVAKLAKQRERNRRMEEYRNKVDAEFEDEEVKLARLASEGSEGAEVRAAGNGKFAIYEGKERITKFDMSLSEAEELLKSLRPAENDDAGNETSDAPEAAGAAREGAAAPRSGTAPGGSQAQGTDSEFI